MRAGSVIDRTAKNIEHAPVYVPTFIFAKFAIKRVRIFSLEPPGRFDADIPKVFRDAFSHAGDALQ